MIRRPLRPSFNVDDHKRLIEAMGTVRSLASIYSGSHGYGSPEDKLVDAVAKAIDDLGFHMTGDDRIFHAPSFNHLASPAPGHEKKRG